MIEVDSNLISSELLLERVRKSVLNKNIQKIEEKEKLVPLMSTTNHNVNVELLNKELNSLRENVRTLDQTWAIHDSDIYTTSKFFPRINIFIKKIIRRLTYWVIIKPYWDQQIAFNGAATRAISDIMKTQEIIVNSVITNKEN